MSKITKIKQYTFPHLTLTLLQGVGGEGALKTISRRRKEGRVGKKKARAARSQTRGSNPGPAMC